MTVDLKSRREVCWDLEVADKATGVSVRAHKPVRKNVALHCTDVWEGRTCGYPSVIKLGDEFRLYYRASGNTLS